MTLEYRIGDVFDRLREIPDGSIDVVITSPPFLALRSYLPADHPDKGKEIGNEATPAAFIDTLLALSAEWGRVLAPHGSLCVELGDTFSGSGGAGGDYLPGGLREGQEAFDGSSRRQRVADADGAWPGSPYPGRGPSLANRGAGWPLAKSLTGIPTLYPWSLAYGRNLLTGQPSPAGQWRIRNVIVWARPNPPVGALGDKFRPATSYITVACRGAKRYFDLDAVRTEPLDTNPRNTNGTKTKDRTESFAGSSYDQRIGSNPAGAPPLDWHTDHHPEDGDWLWKLSTQPYAGSHYATFPMALPKRLIEAMCPLRVCTTCGRPSERITSVDAAVRFNNRAKVGFAARDGRETGERPIPHFDSPSVTTVGWSDCGCALPCPTCRESGVLPCAPHNSRFDDCAKPGSCLVCVGGRIPHAWRTGVVLDPFAGSGTTLEAAQAVGRHAIGIDLDTRNGDLARERCGMFLEIDAGAA